MDIPIDNTYVCSWRRAKNAAKAVFWRDLQDALDAYQAAMMVGATITRSRQGEHVNLRQRPVVPTSALAMAMLPEVRGLGHHQVFSDTFTIRPRCGWQQEVVLAHLIKWAGKTFRFDSGAKGSDRRRLPFTGKLLLPTKGREI